MLSAKKKNKLVAVPHHKYDDYIPDFYRTIHVERGAVEETLKNELYSWTSANPVLLDIPPGQGKTSFIYNHVLPHVKEQHKNLLLVSNRIALSSQQKKTIMALLNDPRQELLTDKGRQQTEDFGFVRIVTYHRLPMLLHDPNAKAWLANLAYVVFDEAHIFAADSLFNRECDTYLRLATTSFCHAIRIYLTATSWDILVPLAAAEEHNFRYVLPPTTLAPREFIRYVASPSFDYYHLSFFKKLDDLLPEIQRAPDQKWLIFVDNKEKGIHFARSLGDCASYIDSSSKNSGTWNSLVNSERFDTQVLVTTAALDSGLNIWDPSLNHVVLVTDNRTSLIQMLGRKRKLPTEVVNLWVCDLDKRVVLSRYNQYRNWRSWYHRAFACTSQKERMALAQAIWNQGDSSLLNLFRLQGGLLQPNMLGYYVIQRRIRLYNSLLDNETTFRKTVERWLAIPDDSSDKGLFIRFYRKHGNQPLTEDQIAELQKIAINLYNSEGCSGIQDKQLNPPGYRTISTILSKIGLPYRVKCQKADWYLIPEE